MEKSKVYFSKIISSERIVDIYKKLGVSFDKNVGVKVHSGEEGNQNYLKATFLKDIIDYVNGTVIECNTAYEGKRNTTDKHLKLMKKHEWTKYYKVDIMDSDGEIELPIDNGRRIQKNYVGKNLFNYDDILVVSHFKGHPMGGYGGALKNISIGMASSYGKAYIHGVGKPKDIWTSNHDMFLEAMADAAKCIMDNYKDHIVFINVMCNMSVDCDCCAKAEDPKIKDVGILASIDPVALDKACIDLVYNSNDPNKKDLIERIESRNGIHTVEQAYLLKVGNIEYDLIDIDNL